MLFAGVPLLTNGVAAEPVQETKHICAGVEYIHKSRKEIPSSVHVLKVERSRPELQLVTTLPSNGFGLSPSTEQVKSIPPEIGQPLGAINGDFFSWRKGPYQGDPAGLQICNGELTSDPSGARSRDIFAMAGITLWIDAAGTPHIGRITNQFEVTWPDGSKTPFGLNEECANDQAVLFTHICGCSTRTTNGIELVLERGKSQSWLPLRIGQTYSPRIREIATTNSTLTTNTLVLAIGDKLSKKLPPLKPRATIKLATLTSPDLSSAPNAISGGPWLVHEAKPIYRKAEAERHPRAGFGFNQTHYFFVIADGRRPGVADGMTFSEFAAEMASWGCEEAINLDGGGSAMLWVNGEIKSQPSENRERPCGNALVLVRKGKPLAHAELGE